MISKFLCILLSVVCVEGLMRNWDYTILSCKVNSTNEDVLVGNTSVDRINRNEYAVSGTIEVKQDLGDDYFIHQNTNRSRSGLDEFFKLPYSFPNQTLSYFVRTSYRQLVMKSFKSCSNLPQVDEHFKGPLRAEKFWLKNCTLNVDDFPSYAQAGYYKIIKVLVGPQLTSVTEGLAIFNVK